MCTILLAPQETMTPFAGEAQWQECNFKRAEHAAEHKLPLSMNWVVVTDEQGNRRLQMRWAVAQSSIPSMRRKSASRSVQPAWGGRVAQLPTRRHE